MALEPALVEVPFATGLAQKTDPRLVEVGSATTLINGMIDKTGAISKRPGTTAINPSGAISPWGHSPSQTACKTRVFRNVIGGMAMIDDQRVWAYSPSLQKYADVDAVSTLAAEEIGISAGISSMSSIDVASNGTWTAMVYSDTSGASLVIVESASQEVVFGPQAMGVGAALGALVARVCICNSQAIVVWQSSAVPTSIYGRALDLTTFTLGAQTLLRADHTAVTGRFDVHTMAGAANRWVLVYAMNAPPDIRVDLRDSTLAVVTTTTFAVAAGMTANVFGVTCHATSGEQIWVSYSCPDAGVTNQHTRALGLNPTTLAVTTADTSVFSFATVLPDTMRIGIERMSATACMVVASNFQNTYTQFRPMTTAGPSWVGARVQYSYVLASKPFTLDGNVCCMVVTPLAGAATYEVIDLLSTTISTGNAPPGRPVCTLSPRVVQKAAAAFNLLPSAAVTAYGAFLVGSSIRNGLGAVGLDLLVVSATFSAHQSAELGGQLYFSGGVPSQYDGQRWTEIGFLQIPPAVLGTAAGGGSMAAGNYTYLAVYEWTDATGVRVQSAPTASASIAVGAGGQVTLVAECQHMTTKDDSERSDRPVGVAFYRTTLAGGTGIFYRVFFGSSIPATATGSPGVVSISYVDQAADADITANETYNTQQLQNGCPPSLQGLVAHQGRLAGHSGTTVWLSKQYDGTNQPSFSDALTIQVGDGGRITALASMDGKLIVFKKDRIFAIAGDGPNTSGIGSSWSDPQLISSDVGCTSDWRSTLVTKDGVIFQSEKKLHMLTRGLEVVYLSQPVETLLTEFATVDFVAYHSRRDEIRIGVRDSDGGSEGRVLNWNYVTGCWSELDYTNQYDGAGSAAHAAFASGAAIDGQFCYVNAYGWVHRENADLTATNAFYDVVQGTTFSSYWVTLTVETAWAKASGILGWGRFWYARIAADRTSPHDLTLSVAHDYNPTYAQTYTWTAAAQLAFSSPLEEVEMHIGQQKCSAIRAKVSDAAPTGVTSTTGSGPTLVGAHFEAGLYKKGKRFAFVQGA